MPQVLPDYSTIGFKDIVVTLDSDCAVAVILINRPKQKNSVNKTIIEELKLAFNLCDRDDRVRVVILTADPTGPAYCSGADITAGWNVIRDEEADREGEHAHRDQGGTLSIAVLRCRKITIAAVNGHAAGVGATAFQLPFDFRFVWADAKITFPFVRRGIPSEAVSTYLLPRLIGYSNASSLLITGHTFPASSRFLQGLYYDVLPTREEVFPAAKAFAEELAKNTSMPAVAYTKALLQHPGESAEENHLLDSRAIRVLSRTKDAQEGVDSFMERRVPKFLDKLGEATSVWSPWWRSLDVTHIKSKL